MNDGTEDNSERKEDTIKVIDECQRIFKLSMGHHEKCTNQNTAISLLEDRMKEECMKNNNTNVTAIMIGDFKMKFKPISARETPLDQHGKYELLWYRVCLAFYFCE